jgi:hypothetical protein
MPAGAEKISGAAILALLLLLSIIASIRIPARSGLLPLIYLLLFPSSRGRMPLLWREVVWEKCQNSRNNLRNTQPLQISGLREKFNSLHFPETENECDSRSNTRRCVL